MKMINEIENTIQGIADDIYETSNIDYFDITFHSNGYQIIVKFIGVDIWNSDDDMREEVNDYGDKEELDTHLRRMITLELSKLSMINLYRETIDEST
ncbi:hypothetical protein N8314_00775 [Akkermansiaceae bacterium]|nr:hypothetical protein [Akkermansiaceae bacterium]